MRQTLRATAIGLLSGCALAAMSVPVRAQTALPSTPAPAPAQQTPAATQVPAAAYAVSGWQVQCSSKSGTLACQALDQVTQRANNAVLISIMVTLGVDGKTPYAVLQTPLGVAVDTPLRVSTPSGASQTLTYLTCTGAGCFARGQLSDALLGAMRSTSNQTLTIVYDGLSATGAKQSITTALSLDGFTAAYAKLH